MPYTRFRSSRFTPCKCVRHDDEGDVQPGLALTPREIAEMTRAGIPISNVNASQFFDGYRTLDFDPGLLSRRGTDITDVWNAQMDSRKKLSKAAKAVKAAPSKEGGE